MKKTIYSALFLSIFYFCSSQAQMLSVKPYFGYATVKMGEVNDDAKTRIKSLAEQTQQALLPPDPLNGDYAWGFQVEYHLEENYFLNVNSYYFREKTATDNFNLFDQPIEFDVNRRIEYFEISIGINYYFDYNSWRRVNTYFGAGGGLGLGWSKSNFKYNDSKNFVNNSGDVSSNALTAYGCLGVRIRLFPFMFLTTEIGAHFANLGQMTGQYRVDQRVNSEYLNYTNKDYTTAAAFNYSGYYITVGTGFVIPFVK
ncbi:MAG: hypothetical protein P8184_15290 [Calditrichia bacterium]